MTHNNFDDVFEDATKRYNAPPAPPREQMWDAIARARAENNVIPLSVSRGMATAPRPIRRWLVSAVGIAAVLVAGIVIGRVSRAPESTSQVAVTPIEQKLVPADTQKTAEVQREVATQQDEAPVAQRNSQRVASIPRNARPLDVSGDDGAYRLAVVDHLVRTEVLLTGFRSASKGGDAAKLDAQFASLSKDLLTTTRLLLAHHTGDPTLSRLLEDLELVLMQLSQYATDGRRADFDAVNQSIEKRNVLPKLRSTIPAGTAMSSGT